MEWHLGKSWPMEGPRSNMSTELASGVAPLANGENGGRRGTVPVSFTVRQGVDRSCVPRFEVAGPTRACVAATDLLQCSVARDLDSKRMDRILRNTGP